jgi:predicted dehydrogenase
MISEGGTKPSVARCLRYEPMGQLLDRRNFLATGATSVAGLVLGSSTAMAAAVDSGAAANGKVSFPDEIMATEPSAGSPPNPEPTDKRMGFAVVGLGRLAVNQIIPAFAQSKKARLAGLVSGTPAKAAALAAQYGVSPSSIYSYDTFEKIKDNPDIQVVYIVLPNALHADFTARAAGAGKHVLCEKPMATSSAEAQRMIDACAKADRKLMIAYRCQYEVFNRAIIEAVRSKALGPVGMIEAANLQNQANDGQWRLRKALAGGGSLPDVGLYCLNGARAILEEEPYEVSATTWNPPGDTRFTEVEDTVSFTLRFPSGAIANCTSSYGLHETRRMRVYGPKGSLSLENAFAYHGQELSLTSKQKDIESVSRQMLEAKNQFALEMDHMATCVAENIKPHTPGEEGLQDHRVMEAIYESARTRKTVKIEPPASITRGPDPISA